MPLPLYEYSGTVYTDIPPGTVRFPLVTKHGWPISFLEAIHIHVYKTASQGESLQELQRPADWNFNAEQSEVVLASPLPAGNALIIRRITPDNNPYVVYAEGTLLTAEQLNRSDQWALCLFQESKDNFANGLGVITGAMIASGTITNTNISDNAEIAVSKLADGNANQVLHTTADGNGVQWRDLTAASTSTAGVVQLSTSTTSTSTTQAAASSAVKAVRDEALAAAAAAQSTANAAMPKAGGTFTGDVDFGTTTATKLPVGTTAQRPAGATGLVRFNTTINQYEGWDGTQWGPLAGAGTYVAKAGDTMTGNLNVPSINNGPLAGFRNAIINGNFDVWQRGTSFTGNEYGADRWVNVRIGSACTMSRISWAPGADPSGANARFACRMTVSSVAGASNAVNLAQRIEDVRTFSGQTITVSFWAKADAVKPIAIDLNQSFGTGGSPGSLVTGIGAQKFTLTTSWAKYTATVNVPSIVGKTIGTDGNDFLALAIWFDAGSNFNSRTNSLGQQSGTFDIAQVQVEAGPVATPFERRPIGTELALCQRYYEVSASNSSRWSGVTVNAQPYRSAVGFAVTKRATPNMVLTESSSSGFPTTPGGTSTGVSGFSEVRTANAAVNGGFYASSWTADAEL